MNYIPITEEDKKEMLERIGVRSIDELVAVMRPKLARELNLPEPMSELELVQHVQALSEENRVLKSFRGAGAYRHYVPSAINHLILRGEFYTAYTPYQPEVSQGTLRAIYEFQTYMCLLTGMDAANASMYDGPTACAEAMITARAATDRNEVFVDERVNPQYVEVLKTYSRFCNFKITNEISERTACVIVQNPNFYGIVENMGEWEKRAHEKGALLVVCIPDPTTLGILKAPGECNVDIVVGDLQSLGNAMSFGGPNGGFMAVKNEQVKRMPGRLCGMTVDTKGNEGFILTLQAREQHIRRHKATSNICTNQSLNALVATIYLSLLGQSGLRKVASLSYERAHSLQKKLQGFGFSLAYDKPFFHEFVVNCPLEPAKINEALAKHHMLGGLDLGNRQMLLCCTEMISEKDIEHFVNAIKEIVK